MITGLPRCILPSFTERPTLLFSLFSFDTNRPSCFSVKYYLPQIKCRSVLAYFFIEKSSLALTYFYHAPVAYPYSACHFFLQKHCNLITLFPENILKCFYHLFWSA